jgi:signal transduction histidine kinase
VSNLVRNAVEHSRPGSEVTVRVGGTSERTTITIENATAPVSGHRSRAKPGRPAADGHGFGLIVARRLVEACGGQIDVGSTPDRWTVSVNLPVLEEAAPPGQVLHGRAAS